MLMSPQACQRARLARDARYDGHFFTAVKTTGIYCRSICPAPPPLEKNVEYFATAYAAAQAGYRPCLRCRPDSAPHSPAWQGTQTTLHRALRLIDQDGLPSGGLPVLAARLGISERYLRQLFQDSLGLSPKAYSLYKQCLLAKKLLHETTLPITDIALASGFASVRRFNDAFKQQFGLSPSAIRRQSSTKAATAAGGVPITLSLAYRPPYDWVTLRDFYASRAIEGLEWVGDEHYGRTFQFDPEAQGASPIQGHFTVRFTPKQMAVTIVLSDLTFLPRVISQIRRCFDVDADPEQIDSALQQAMGTDTLQYTGGRLPGIWSPFEAGVRAILGQQVSVLAAKRLVTQLVAMNPANEAGEKGSQRRYFPTPSQLLTYDLQQLGMPERRRETLRQFALFAQDGDVNDTDALLAIPGIGPWTVNYLRMRGLSDPDVLLDGDLGVKKALAQCACSPALAAPWRSYLTLYLWKTLS
ncbi:DNA-3-methyladenine glycosylase 2 family protein [Photobacterium aphoticum]|uniref:DNA-3-methyladenine glycosylase II n=2 Tax=Photobacterium aphoticum TaxID=754436 RepID=A0A0J1GHN2_9GAMM|nr:ADA regulatory protein [Photobacterium aphoticum]GHA45718.1 3-methyladenine DNA glycosylase [Photobacterium aphoticum]